MTSPPEPPRGRPAAPPSKAARWDTATVVVALGLFPLTLVTEGAVPANPLGPDANLLNSAWLLVLLMGATSAAVHRPRPAALRALAPYGVFLVLATLSLAATDHPREGLGLLARLGTPAVVYVAAWSAMGDERTRLGMARMAKWWIVAAATTYVLLGVADVIPAIDFPERLAALSLVMLFPVATMGQASVVTARWLGAIAAATAVASGSRMASLAVLVVVLVSPSLGISVAKRALLVIAALLAFGAALQTAPFQDRWFEGGGTLRDLVGIEENVSTSGRRDVWQALGRECGSSWLTGKGIGSADALGAAVNPGFPQPHNEYLRIYCDQGVAGSLVFWTFFVLVGWRAVTVVRRHEQVRAPALASLQLLAGLLLLSLTDNPLTATLQFMAPAAVVFAWSDRVHSTRRNKRLR